MMANVKRKVKPLKFGRRYDWDEWFARAGTRGEDGDLLRVTLKRGLDYDVETHGMVAMVRNNASQRGIPVTVNTLPNAKGLVFLIREDR